jgi:hypothetical protein
MAILARFLSNEDGVTAIEYALIASLGVWSRNEMARVDFEGSGVVRPFIADGLIGRSPF